MSFRGAFERMPQTGAMMLLDEVLTADETTIVCRARDHRVDNYPLRTEGLLMGVSLVELGAQAAAAHASLHGIGRPHRGLLAALHNVTVQTGAGLDGPLEVRAERLYFDDGWARYRFTITCGADKYMWGDASLVMEPVEP